MPKENRGGRALIRAISCSSTRACAAVRPPPPYSLGHMGAVQPFSAMRSSQILLSGLAHLNLAPPQGVSSAVRGVRMEAGQLASSHSRVSVRNTSSSVPKSAM